MISTENSQPPEAGNNKKEQPSTQSRKQSNWIT